MKKQFLSALVFLLLLLTATVLTAAKTEAAPGAPRLHRTTLDNGLTLLVKEVPGAKAAAVQIWVKAGSAYEEPREAGITHFIEHMIFKGTPTRAAGELAESVERVGGRINAYTSNDYTVYHATLPGRHWQTAMEVLTDAVLNASFDPVELEREKKVVLEEIRMRNDQPATKLVRELMATAYASHPYGRPVIGTAATVSSFSRDDILRYKAGHYRAGNIAVVVVGDLPFAEVRSSVAALTASLPRGNGAAPQLSLEPFPSAARLFAVKEQVQQAHLAVALPIPAFSSPDAAVFDVISLILGGGESSRLYRELRDRRGLVLGIGASAFTPRDPGLLEVTATLDPGKGMTALAAALEEIFKLKYGAVEEAELERAKRNLESDFIFNLERVDGQARVMGSFHFLTGDPREDDYLARVRAVTAGDIIRVASAFFLPERVIAGLLVPQGSDVDLDRSRFETLIAGADRAARSAASPVPAAGDLSGNGHRFVLSNGIRLVVRENPAVPTVAIRVVFPGGLRGESAATNGNFAFVSEMLTKGTDRMSGRELAVAVADMAGSLSGFSGKNTFGIEADFLSRFFERAMVLVRDVIRTPAFDGNEAEKIRPELLARLKMQEDSLPSLAFREFNGALFAGHPYGLNPLGSAEVLARVSAAELRDLYERHARPDAMVIAVAGDVRAGEVLKVVTDLFGDWESDAEPPAAAAILPPEPTASPLIRTVERNKEQVHLVTGFLGTTLKAADRYPLEILETVLDGQSGRLFTELRDRQSLAYSLSAFSMLGLDTGSFGIYLATSPGRKGEALKAVWRELDRMREGLLTEAELRKAKNVVIGRYEMGLQTNGALALEAALNECYGLGLDFGSRYVGAIEQVTAEAVREVARKTIRPDRYVSISVGAGEAPGK